MIELQCSVSSRTDHDTIWPMPFILLKRGKFISMAKEAKSCRPSVKAPNTASVLAIVGLRVDVELLHVVVLVLHLLDVEEGRVLGLGHADRVEQVAVGGDVDRLHVDEKAASIICTSVGLKTRE